MAKNDNNTKEYNKLCEACEKDCKQNKSVVLISCQRFKAKPKQLEFSFKFMKVK